ncbi:type II toxin-antitoxin system HicB family antitoxin [Vibrio cyclitrophicus]
MSKLLKYNGFSGSVSCSLEDSILHGKIECINDLVTYEAESVCELKAAFEEAVDDYLETCKYLEKQPDKPMSGTFNVRIGEEMHKKAYLAAKSQDISLNDLVKTALEEKLSTKKELHMHVHLQENKFAKENQVFTSALSSIRPMAKEFKYRPAGHNLEKATGVH